tara:strand:- start:600 stop:2132 length:1533 start_codon:yes stop_codon:yes gene_type:complete
MNNALFKILFTEFESNKNPQEASDIANKYLELLGEFSTIDHSGLRSIHQAIWDFFVDTGQFNKADMVTDIIKNTNTDLLKLHYFDIDPRTIYQFHLLVGENIKQQCVPSNPDHNLISSHCYADSPTKLITLGFLISKLWEKTFIIYWILSLIININSDKFLIKIFTNTFDPSMLQGSEELNLLESRVQIVELPNFEASVPNAERYMAFSNIIKNNSVKILIDLDGYAQRKIQNANEHLLPTFLYCPSPIQITWLGYPNTTGLQEIKYKLTDEYVDPPQSPQFYTETLIRLRYNWIFFPPHLIYPQFSPISELPFHKNNTITFGVFNKPSKWSLKSKKLWSKILIRIPQSKLIIKFSKLSFTPSLKKAFIAFMEAQGISPNRIHIIKSPNDYTSYLNLYRSIDIQLDTIPYSGYSTTANSLYMGVPVFTIAGTTHVQNRSSTLLYKSGLSECVGTCEESIINKISQFIGKGGEYMQNIRERLQQDSYQGKGIFNGKAQAREFEQLFEKLLN